VTHTTENSRVKLMRKNDGRGITIIHIIPSIIVMTHPFFSLESVIRKAIDLFDTMVERNIFIT